MCHRAGGRVIRSMCCRGSKASCGAHSPMTFSRRRSRSATATGRQRLSPGSRLPRFRLGHSLLEVDPARKRRVLGEPEELRQMRLEDPYQPVPHRRRVVTATSFLTLPGRSFSPLGASSGSRRPSGAGAGGAIHRSMASSSPSQPRRCRAPGRTPTSKPWARVAESVGTRWDPLGPVLRATTLASPCWAAF